MSISNLLTPNNFDIKCESLFANELDCQELSAGIINATSVNYTNLEANNIKSDDVTYTGGSYLKSGENLDDVSNKNTASTNLLYDITAVSYDTSGGDLHPICANVDTSTINKTTESLQSIIQSSLPQTGLALFQIRSSQQDFSQNSTETILFDFTAFTPKFGTVVSPGVFQITSPGIYTVSIQLYTEGSSGNTLSAAEMDIQIQRLNTSATWITYAMWRRLVTGDEATNASRDESSPTYSTIVRVTQEEIDANDRNTIQACARFQSAQASQRRISAGSFLYNYWSIIKIE